MNYAHNKHYLDRYLRFIASRQSSDGYVERHHIYPRSMFPQLADDPKNLIALTAREHFIAHWMLHKAFGEQMTQAFMYMRSACDDHERYWNLNAKAYEELRIAFGKAMSKAKLGVKLSDQARGNMSESKMGVPLSESHRLAIGAGNTGRVVSQETRQRISAAKKRVTPNRVVTDSYRVLMQRPKTKSACSCCGKLVAVNMLNRWHNDNCKSLAIA